MTYNTTIRRRVGLRALGLAALSLALCGTLANAASASLGGVQRVSASSVTDSAGVKSVTVYCPARTRLIGTAARVTDGGGQVVLEDIAPTAQLSGLTVTAHEDADGWSGNWYVTATAICGYPAGLELVRYTEPPSLETRKRPDTFCPSGKVILGSGAEATGTLQHSAAIDGPSYPLPPSKVDRAWIDVYNTAGWDYQATGYAICADPPPGLELVTASSPTDSAPSGGKSVTAFCPSGKRLVGTGGGTSGSFGEVHTTAMAPANPLTESSTATGLEGQGGFPWDWWVVSEAICASP
jgi:hypothetical protein